jgi:hypothetical protein
MFTKFQPSAFMTKFSHHTLSMIFIIFQQKLHNILTFTGYYKFQGSRVEFLFNKVATGQDFLQVIPVFSCQYHSTSPPSS